MGDQMNADNQPQPAPNAPAAVKSAPATRRPLWRGCLTLGVTVVILVLALAVVLWLLRGTHAKPLDVRAYPFARTVSSQQLNDNADQSVYLTGDALDKVASFYIGMYGKAATEYDNGCIAATVPASKAGGAPVQVAQCFTDTTFLDITQSISVKIEPSPNGSAQVMIVIDRIW